MSTNLNYFRKGFRQRLIKLMVGVRDRQPDIRPGPHQCTTAVEKRLVRYSSVLSCLSLYATIRAILGNWLGTGLPKLTALRVRKAKPRVYADGDGLYLCVSSSMSHTWVFRFS